MDESRTEIPLSGGRTTPGVVRVGDTVRKPATDNSAFIAGLLEHLAASGSDFSPEFSGFDDRGRIVLGYIDGTVPRDLSIFHDQTLKGAARLIRRFHDLSSEYANVDAEVVCHNDLSPCNFVFRDDAPVAIIDFDAAAPGTRAHDLGYAAWLWLDLGSPKIDAVEQRRRLDAFLEAYGMCERTSILEAMLLRQATLIEEGRRCGDDALSDWASECKAWIQHNLHTLS
ncbi:MAG: phosphotransferase [Pseudomonadota bacterium]